MGRKTRNFRDPGLSVLEFMRGLMFVDRPFETPFRSATATKSECFAFRQRLYAWRYQMFIALADYNNPDYEDNANWLKEKLGPRGDKIWLDLTVFQVEVDPTAQPNSEHWILDPGYANLPDKWYPRDSAPWQVVGRIKRPMAGSLPIDPLETGPGSLAEAKAILDAALAARRNPPPRPALSVVEPAEGRVYAADEPIPPFDPENPL